MTELLTVPSRNPLDAPLTGLEQVIEAAMADPAHWRAFEELLSTVDLFVAPDGHSLAAIKPGETGMRVLRPEDTMEVKGVTLDDGRVAAGAFTDPRRLKAVWGEDTVFIAMNGRQVLHLFREGPMILNPGSPRVMVFQKDDIAALLDAATRHAQAAQANGAVSEGGRPSGKVDLSMPNPIPDVLVQRLAAAFGPVGGTGITAAWLARAHWSEVDRRGFYLDVRTARPSDEIRAMVERAVSGVGFGSDTLDVAVGPAREDGVGVRVV
jgi:hypothetical protein